MSNSLTLRIGADLTRLNNSLTDAEKRLKRFGFKAERIGRDLTTRVSLPIVSIGAAAVKSFAQFDRIEKGLAALGGSTRAGAEQFQRLNKIVLDTRTTLDLKTAALGAQRLQGAGLSAAFAERTIKQLGIAATVSGSAIDDVGGVLRQFTQIVGKGKIEQEDLNTILDRMPALGAVIKEEFGGVTAEAIRNTGISMKEFVSRTVTAIETNEDFQGIQGGLAKSFESFANAVQVGIVPLGKAIAASLNLEKKLQRLGDFIGKVSQKFADLEPNTQRFIVLSLSAVAAIGPLSLGLGAVAKSLPLLRSGFSLFIAPVKAAGVATINASIALSGYAKLIKTGTIPRNIQLIRSLRAVRTAFALATGPIGLAVAAIATLVIAFRKAYKNSNFFRGQILRLKLAFDPIIKEFKRLVNKIFPDLSEAFDSIGSVFNTVFAAIAAGISFSIEAFLSLVENIKVVGKAIKLLFKFQFAEAREAIGESLFNPEVFIQKAKDAAKAAVTTFKETVDGAPIKVKEDGGGGGGGGGGGSKTIDILSGAFSNLGLEVARSKAAFDAFGKSQAELPKLGGLTGVSFLDEEMEKYRKKIELTNESQAVFGSSFDGLSEKIGITKQAISGLIEGQLPGYQEQVAKLSEDLALLNAEQTANNEKLAEAAEAAAEAAKAEQTLASVTSSAFDSVTQALSKGANAFKAFTNAILGSVRKAIAAKIKLAVTSAASKALVSAPFPINIGLAAAAGAGASALFDGLLNTLKIPALAEGGIATGATLALIGEGRESEAILPISKLQGLLDMNGGGGGPVQFRISGEDLVAVYDQGRARQNRIY